MRLTQVVPAESYTVSGLYTESFMGNVFLTVESKCIFIIQSVLFIISYIILLLLFRSIYFLFVITIG